MSIEKSAGAVIFRKENKKIYYLLLHYQWGHWDFPKGHIEKGEDALEAARREVFEETGLKDITFIKGFQEVNKYFFKFKGKTIFKSVVFYLAETQTKEVKISFEHIGFKWLPFKEALNQLTFKNAKEIFKQANDFLKKHG